MLRLSLSTLLLSGVSLLSASSVTVGCNPATGGTTPNPFPPTDHNASCSGYEAYTTRRADAAASLGYTLAAPLSGDYNKLRMRESVSAGNGYYPDDPFRVAYSSASAAFNFNEQFATVGTERGGFLQVSYTSAAGIIYTGDSNITAGVLPTGRGPDPTLTCSGKQTICGLSEFGPNNPPLIPYELGQPFTLSAIGSMHVYPGQFDFASSGDADVSYLFRFFEADGVTPVTVAHTPEPSTVGLIGAATLVLGYRRKSGHKSKTQ